MTEIVRKTVHDNTLVVVVLVLSDIKIMGDGTLNEQDKSVEERGGGREQLTE